MILRFHSATFATEKCQCPVSGSPVLMSNIAPHRGHPMPISASGSCSTPCLTSSALPSPSRSFTLPLIWPETTSASTRQEEGEKEKTKWRGSSEMRENKHMETVGRGAGYNFSSIPLSVTSFVGSPSSVRCVSGRKWGKRTGQKKTMPIDTPCEMAMAFFVLFSYEIWRNEVERSMTCGQTLIPWSTTYSCI